MREENSGEDGNRYSEAILHVAAYTNNSLSNQLQFNSILRYGLQSTLHSACGHAEQSKSNFKF